MEHLDDALCLRVAAGEVAEAELERWQQHLDRCAPCSERFAEARAQALIAAAEERPKERVSAASGRQIQVGRYIVVSRLGKGGMGVVLAAYDPELDRKVALKLLQADGGLGQDVEQAQARLQREAQAMAKLSHPNVVAVYDVGRRQDHVFIAMELVDGMTLRAWAAGRRRRRKKKDILDAFIAAGRGLAAAHAVGLVHRDFKPENVLVGKDGRVRVTDFGLARLHDEALQLPSVDEPGPSLYPSTDSPSSENPRLLESNLTESGLVLGTPAYMSPEQFRGQPADARSDQFSFAVSLYEALYGERPFGGASPAAYGAEVRAGNVRPPPKGTSVPGWLRRILLRALRASPEERFPSMDALLEVLLKDPAITRRRWVLGAAAVVGVIGAAELLSRVESRRQALCQGAEAQLQGTWDSRRKASLLQAFVATGLPYAQETWTHVEAAVDNYTRAWVAMRAQACEATRVRKQQSEEVMDLRMGCLDQRKEELTALVSLWGAADRDTITKAPVAASSLTPLSECADVRALRDVTPPPRDANARILVGELRRRLAIVQGLRQVGRSPEAVDKGAKLLEDARAVGYNPLIAEILFALGLAQADMQTFAEAKASFLEAAQEADAARNDRLRFLAVARLAWVMGDDNGLHQIEDARVYLKSAGAVLSRVGHDTALDIEMALTSNMVHASERNYAEAIQDALTNVTLSERAYGDSPWKVVVAYNTLGTGYLRQGRTEEARAAYEKALAIGRRGLGRSHPLLRAPLLNLSNLATGPTLSQSLQYAREGVTLTEAALGTGTPADGLASYILAERLFELWRFSEAMEYHERSRASPSEYRYKYQADATSALAIELFMLGQASRGLDTCRKAAILTKRLSPQGTTDLLDALTCQGLGELAQHRANRAVSLLQRALTLAAQDTRNYPIGLAFARFTLGRALWETDPKAHRHAVALVREARGAYDGCGRDVLPAQTMDAWLDQHRLP